MSGRDQEAASGEVSNALRRFIVFQIDGVMDGVSGATNGYGLSETARERIGDALQTIKDELESATFRIVRPDVRDAIVRLARERVTAEKTGEAWSDGEYLGFRNKLTGRPGWNGNKKLRAEVEALYKPES
jgi:hypothetical protein